jgi:hypothetical protein
LTDDDADAFDPVDSPDSLDMDPSEAADMATGEAGGAVTRDPAGGSSWVDALRSTEPNKPLSQYDGMTELSDNWDARLLRGVEKIGGYEASEAWVDLLLGAVGAALETMEDRTEAGSQASAAEPAESMDGEVDVHGRPVDS